MVAAVAYIPSPPLLLAALGGGPPDLRSACQKAISVLGGVDRVVVLGAGPVAGWVTGSVDASSWGARSTPCLDPLPLALAVGSTLLGQRPHELFAVAGDALPELAAGTGLLVVGDGSARRSEKAPGHYDARAEGFDVTVARAFSDGDPRQLADLDPELAADLLVGGLAAWQAAAALTAGTRWQASLHLDAAPYGVGYLVASWTPVNSGSHGAAS